MVIGGLSLLAAGPRAADAAEARHRFVIRPKPYAEALIDLALQSGISLLAPQACGTGTSRGLSGVYTLREALDAVKAGAPCSYRVVDTATVRMLPSASPPQRTTPPPPPVPAVTELMVTATRRPERLDDLPAGISVISGQQIWTTGFADARDTGSRLVGMLNTNLGPGRDKILMRGLSDGAFTGRARSTVATYLDDVPINYNAPDPALRLVDIERVEAVRGPQGSLYGAGALSGVYRIVANKPDLERFGAEASGQRAWTSGGAASRVVEGVLNVPLMHGRLGLRLVGYDEVLGGYVDDVALRLSDVDSTTRRGGRASLRFAPSDAWQADLSTTFQQLHSKDSQYTTPTVGVGRRANRVREGHDNQFLDIALRLRGGLGWADLASSTSFVRHDYGSRYDASTATSQFAAGYELGVYSEAARVRRLTQDLVLTSVNSGTFSWLAGAYASASVELTPSFLLVRNGAEPPATVYNERRRDHLKETALYGEVTWRFSPTWTLAAGARGFQIDRRVAADIMVSVPGGTRIVAGNRGFSGFSPKVSLQHTLPSGDLIYALFSEGYRAGGVNSTGLLPIREARVTFRPDRLQNFELGVKTRLFDDRLAVRAAAFHDIWTNLQSDHYRVSGLAYTANVGDVHIEGLEVEAAYEWANGLAIQANGLFSSPKFSRTNPDFSTPLGAGLPGSPKLSGGLTIRYERPLRGELVLRLLADATYVGRSRLTFAPSLLTMGDLVQARLSAQIATDRWLAGVFVTNPGNASGDTFAYGNPFSFGQVRQVTPQRPRTIGMRLSANY